MGGNASKIQLHDAKKGAEEEGKRADELQLQLLQVQQHLEEMEREGQPQHLLLSEGVSSSKATLEHELQLQKNVMHVAETRAEFAEMEVIRLKETLRERVEKIVELEDAETGGAQQQLQQLREEEQIKLHDEAERVKALGWQVNQQEEEEQTKVEEGGDSTI